MANVETDRFLNELEGMPQQPQLPLNVFSLHRARSKVIGSSVDTSELPSHANIRDQVAHILHVASRSQPQVSHIVEARTALVAELSVVIFQAERAVHRQATNKYDVGTDWRSAYTKIAEYLTQQGYHSHSAEIDRLLFDARPASLGSQFPVYEFLGYWERLERGEIGQNPAFYRR